MLLDKVQQANKGAEQEPYISSALDCTQCPGKSAIQPRLEPQFTVQSLSGRARAQCFLKKKCLLLEMIYLQKNNIQKLPGQGECVLQKIGMQRRTAVDNTAK